MPGKMFRAVKGHVFREMGQSLLILILENAAGIHHQPELCPVLWFMVLHYIVGQAIIEPACQYIRMEWNGFRQVLRMNCLRIKYRQANDNK